MYLINNLKHWIPYAHAPTFMRTLSKRVRNWCAPWACVSVPYAHAQHAHQFSYFSNVHFVYPQHARKNWCVHWACVSGADACTEHARQELMRTRSIRVRNWCVHWAYVLGTNVCTECIPFKKCWAYASGNDAYPEHTGQELMHSLSIRVRNWCVPWAYASVSYKLPRLFLS